MCPQFFRYPLPKSLSVYLQARHRFVLRFMITTPHLVLMALISRPDLWMGSILGMKISFPQLIRVRYISIAQNFLVPLKQSLCFFRKSLEGFLLLFDQANKSLSQKLLVVS